MLIVDTSLRFQISCSTLWSWNNEVTNLGHLLALYNVLSQPGYRRIPCLKKYSNKPDILFCWFHYKYYYVILRCIYSWNHHLRIQPVLLFMMFTDWLESIYFDSTEHWRKKNNMENFCSQMTYWSLSFIPLISFCCFLYCVL